MTVLAPTSLAEAVQCLAKHPDARPLAGCTDAMVRAAPGNTDPKAVIDLLRIPELTRIVFDGRSFSIGATVTFDALRRDDDVRRRLPPLSSAAAVIGGWQIQARATVGGNIANASPAGDSLPVWLALGATAVLRGPSGTRDVPYEDMHLGYRQTALGRGEIIERVVVPVPEVDTHFWFRKVGQRQALAISKVVLVAAIRLERGVIRSARVAAGSVAPVPMRIGEVERSLIGRAPSAALADHAGRLAADAVQPIDDVRSTAAYRRYVLDRLVRRMVLDLTAREGTT